MTYTFEDAEPIKAEVAPKEKAPNPFKDVVAAIALKTNPETKKPLAKAFKETFEDADDRKTIVGRVKRLTSEAGAANDPAVTVRVDDKTLSEPVVDAKGNIKTLGTILFTIWTVKRQMRPKTATQTASTPQSVPVTPAKGK